ncbi:MAG: type II toxin-antitoxin system Phd/YefM family antitoxin [Acidobacteria bacterium]|nr:type II toxin-antitoxin system Phd/YefM family antitoxin [Acidobacteriota bacterium]
MAGINYIVDQEGNRTAAVLPLPEYSALLEELLEDAALGRLVREIPDDQRTTS